MTRVMVVEDQQMQRENLERVLNESGRYEVVASIDNADIADLYVESRQVELALLDVFTAFGADGLEAAERIKRDYPHVRVIITTSSPESAWIERARNCGVESFWYKAAEKDAILSVCDRTMSGESVYP